MAQHYDYSGVLAKWLTAERFWKAEGQENLF